jgi:hypothetical protein
MEFKTKAEIKDWLRESGFFIFKRGATYSFMFKTGEGLEDNQEMLGDSVSKLAKIIKNNVVNPFIEIGELKKLFSVVDLQLIEKYNKQQTKINNLERGAELLKGSRTFVYCKKENKYYSVQKKRFKKHGIFGLDFNLIPEGEDIRSFNDYNSLKNAYEYTGMENKYKEDYEKEKAKYDSLSILNWEEDDNNENKRD